MDLPTVSLTTFLASPTSSAGKEEARKAAESLILTGAVIVADERATKDANDRFLDLFEDYFALGDEELRGDERPEYGYQVVRSSRRKRAPTLAYCTGQQGGRIRN